MEKQQLVAYLHGSVLNFSKMVEDYEKGRLSPDRISWYLRETSRWIDEHLPTVEPAVVPAPPDQSMNEILEAISRNLVAIFARLDRIERRQGAPLSDHLDAVVRTNP